MFVFHLTTMDGYQHGEKDWRRIILKWKEVSEIRRPDYERDLTFALLVVSIEGEVINKNGAKLKMSVWSNVYTSEDFIPMFVTMFAKLHAHEIRTLHKPVLVQNKGEL